MSRRPRYRPTVGVDVRLVDGHLALSDTFRAQIEAHPIAKCEVCSNTPTDDDADQWRVWALREPITWHPFGVEHLAPSVHPAGHAYTLCGGCTAQLRAERYRPLARIVVDQAALVGVDRGQAVTEMTIWFLRIRAAADELTADAWFAQALGDATA